MKVGYIADIHLKGGYQTLEAQALSRACEKFKSEHVDIVCVCGDVYHSVSTPEQRLVFRRFLDRLTTAGMSVVVIRGNHDQKDDLNVFLSKSNVYVAETPFDFDVCWNAFEAGLYDIELKELKVLTLPHFNTSSFFLERNNNDIENVVCDTLNGLIESYRAEVIRCKELGNPVVLIGHCVMDGAALDNGFIPKGDGIHVNAKLLSSLGIPVVMGHYHEFQEVEPSVFYVGSPERLNYGEKSDKGVLIQEWDDNKRVWKEAQFHSLNPVERVELSSDSDFDLIPIVGKMVKINHTLKKSDPVDISHLINDLLNRGAKEVIINTTVVPEVAMRSEKIAKCSTVLDCLLEWVDSKGLNDKKESVKEVYKEICCD